MIIQQKHNADAYLWENAVLSARQNSNEQRTNKEKERQKEGENVDDYNDPDHDFRQPYQIYLDGKFVCPDEDILLCNVETTDTATGIFNLMHKVRIYATEKGMFYMIEEKDIGRKVTAIDRDTALQYMSNNAAYIVTEGYDKIFGKPERG